MIDKVDSASNNQVFVDFLAQLRGYYLEREETPIFHSVTLAGVYDIKYLKLKLRPESDHKYNSPWNIAAKFKIDMTLRKFVEYFDEIYGGSEEKFIENCGRKFFLLYLKPIINGTGNYYIEAQTRDARRTDVIVDYLGERFIVELKIWHGEEYNKRGEAQLTDYLEYYHKDKGYMLSFNFNKKKETGVKEIRIGDKTIVEAVV